MSNIDTIDTANMQKLVNVLSQRHPKLDDFEEDLEEKLLKFTEFCAEETPEKELIPIQFKKENHKKFKEFSIPISRAMYSALKVGGFLIFDKKLIPIEPMEMLPYHTEEKESISQKVANSTKKMFSKFIATTPELKFNNMLTDIIIMQKKWKNIVHHYELGIRKRPKINTKKRLQQTLDNIIIAFNVFVEIDLVMTVHYANEITKGETEIITKDAIVAYLTAKERHRDQPLPIR